MSNHLVCSIAAHKSVSGQLFQCSWITRPKGMLHGYSDFPFVFKKASFAADKLTAAKWRLLITI